MTDPVAEKIIDQLKSDEITEIVEASEHPEESIRQLSNQLSRRTDQLYQEYWERCRFCECGAESLKECECDVEKREAYRQRTSRKVNDDLGKAPYTILLLSQEYGVNLSNSADSREKKGEGDTE